MTPQELRKLRLKLDKTQQEMADLLLMSRQYYSASERGKYAISARTARLANQLYALDIVQI